MRSSIKNIFAVAKREFASYFLTPVGYIVVGIFALITGMGFVASFFLYAQVSVNPAEHAYSSVPNFEETLLSPFLVFCATLFMFIGPFITMRLLAEERNRGTMELLLTHPLRDRDIIFGKYLAALGMFAVMMGVVAVHLCIIGYYVEIEPAVLVFGLLAVFLMGAAVLSLGLFISAMCANQISASVITFGLLFASYIVGHFAENMAKKNPTPDAWGATAKSVIGFGYSFVRTFLQQFAIDAHAKEMAKGIVDPKDPIYYVLFTVLFLFFTFRALESRKWRA